MGEQHVVWEEPSAAGGVRRRVSWPALLEPLKRRPGEWARVADYVGETSAYKVAQKLRGHPGLSPTGEWEFRARKVPGEGSRLYARYTGAPGEVDRAEGSTDPEAVRIVYEATRALLQAAQPREVVRVLVGLVEDLGGWVVPASEADERALPADLCFGEGSPLLPAAEEVSVGRLRLEAFLPAVLDDARRVVTLLRQQEVAGRRSPSSDPYPLVIE